MTSLPEPEVRITRYSVSCIPPDDINASSFTITVEHHPGDGLWSASDGYNTLDADGCWQEDPSKRRHRHDESTALRLAQQAAPHMKAFNGKTVADALARIAEREAGA